VSVGRAELHLHAERVQVPIHVLQERLRRPPRQGTRLGKWHKHVMFNIKQRTNPYMPTSLILVGFLILSLKSLHYLLISMKNGKSILLYMYISLDLMKSPKI
jgi:hypothetical protein